MTEREARVVEAKQAAELKEATRLARDERIRRLAMAGESERDIALSTGWHNVVVRRALHPCVDCRPSRNTPVAKRRGHA